MGSRFRGRRSGGRTSRTRIFGFIGVLSVVAALLPGALFSAASATTLDVSYTLQGCNLDHGGTINTVSHICSDDAYTTGNLGKSWAELDRVPMRVTLKNGGATTQGPGSFAVAGDYINNAGTAVGWDQISTLSLASTADAGCPS